MVAKRLTARQGTQRKYVPADKRTAAVDRRTSPEPIGHTRRIEEQLVFGKPGVGRQVLGADLGEIGADDHRLAIVARGTGTLRITAGGERCGAKRQTNRRHRERDGASLRANPTDEGRQRQRNECCGNESRER